MFHVEDKWELALILRSLAQTELLGRPVTHTLVETVLKHSDATKVTGREVDLAVRHGLTSVVRWLVQHGYPFTNEHARLALKHKQLEVMRCLLEVPAFYPFTVVNAAIATNAVPFVELFLTHGFSFNPRAVLNGIRNDTTGFKASSATTILRHGRDLASSAWACKNRNGQTLEECVDVLAFTCDEATIERLAAEGRVSRLREVVALMPTNEAHVANVLAGAILSESRNRVATLLEAFPHFEGLALEHAVCYNRCASLEWICTAIRKQIGPYDVTDASSPSSVYADLCKYIRRATLLAKDAQKAGDDESYRILAKHGLLLT